MADPILFAGGIPSNLYLNAVTLPNPFTLIPRNYASNEHRFQAMKGRDVFEHNWVADASNPYEARRRGRLLPLGPNELYEWDNFRALPAMLEVNLVKFTTSHVCFEWLKQTDDSPLIEHRADPIWGDNLDGTGKNLLGAVLEVVRIKICG